MAFSRGDEEARHELRLVFGEAPDAAIGLDEPDGEEVVELRMEDIEIEAQAPVVIEDQVIVDEGKSDFVTRGINEKVGLDLGPVGEADHAALKLRDLRLDADAAVGGELRQHRVHRGVGVHEGQQVRLAGANLVLARAQGRDRLFHQLVGGDGADPGFVKVARHVGSNGRRHQFDDLDARIFQLEAERLGVGVHRGLGRAVDRHCRNRDESERGRDVDHRALVGGQNVDQ